MLKLYYIDCLTNLHVGSGEANYNIVDKEVEKDPILGCPVVHASGIKGALRKKCGDEGMQNDKILEFFGKPSSDKEMTTGGSWKFFDARFLYRPIRCEGSRPCINTTDVKTLEIFAQTTSDFGMQTEATRVSRVLPKLLALDFETNKFWASVDVKVDGESTGRLQNDIIEALKPILGEAFAIAQPDAMRECALPVIARNCLDGKGNLWYEEFVPYGSRFYTFVVSPDDGVEDCVLKDTDMVQIGGNSSIGYGYCKFTKKEESSLG